MIKIEEKDVDIRIDKFLSDLLNISRTKIKEYSLLVNGKEVKNSYKLQLNDELVYSYIEEKKEKKQKDIELDIVYEDEYIAVVNKPYDLIVHSAISTNETTMVDILEKTLDKLADINEDRKGIVHRLDKDTTGLLIVAKTNEAYERLIESFKNRDIKKTYVAIVKGSFPNKKIRIENYIGRDKKNRYKYSTNTDKPKLAISIFSLIDKNDNYSLVKVEILTGRTHQIRVHAKGLGFPILGDNIYGKKDKFARQQLHAYSIEFKHPISDEIMHITKKPYKDMMDNILKLGLNFDIIKNME